MQTFRLPRELVAFLKADAAKNGLDLTAGAQHRGRKIVGRQALQPGGPMLELG
jgi:hypothetical protein